MAGGRKVQKARQIDLVKASTDALKSYIKNEGKRLNQQLVEIQNDRQFYKASFAYKALVEKPSNASFLGKSKSGNVKVNLTTRGKTRQELQQIAGLIQSTVSAQTITRSGIRKYYGNVFAKLRAKYPGLASFTDEQLSDILTTEGFESAKAADGSDRIFKLIGKSESAEAIVTYIEKRNGFKDIVEANNQYGIIMNKIKKEQVDNGAFYNPFEND